MTHVLLVAPMQELVIHNIPIFDNMDVKTVQTFIKDKEKDYGELTRILFSLGDVHIMKPEEQIPIPLQGAPRGQGR